MFLPRGPYLPQQHNSLCTSIKQEHCHLLAALLCVWGGAEVRTRAGHTLMCVCVCVDHKGAPWCTEGVAIPAARVLLQENNVLGPWQLVKDSTVLELLPLRCVFAPCDTQHIFFNTHIQATRITSESVKWDEVEILAVFFDRNLFFVLMSFSLCAFHLVPVLIVFDHNALNL